MAEVLRREPPSLALERLGVAFADPIRRSVLMMLTEGPSYPTNLAVRCGTTLSNLSNHLACLRGCGLVVSEREGRRIRYELAVPEIAVLLRELAVVLDSAGTCQEHLT